MTSYDGSSLSGNRFSLEQAQKVYNTDIDLYFDLFDRFLEGFRASVFSPNSLRCSQRIRASALDYNRTIIGYINAPEGSQPQSYVFNLTRVISNSTADAVGECYTTMFNYYQYIVMRISQFPDLIGILTAFL